MEKQVEIIFGGGILNGQAKEFGIGLGEENQVYPNGTKT